MKKILFIFLLLIPFSIFAEYGEIQVMNNSPANIHFILANSDHTPINIITNPVPPFAQNVKAILYPWVNDSFHFKLLITLGEQSKTWQNTAVLHEEATYDSNADCIFKHNTLEPNILYYGGKAYNIYYQPACDFSLLTITPAGN